jgi:hypothetical protein
MPYKNFTPNVLPASDVNNYLMNQSVIVFDSVAQRSATLTVPIEGMVTYLKDTNTLWFYNGTSWISINNVPHADIRNRIMSADNNFSNQTSFVDFPIAADKTALDLTFIKVRSDTKLVVQLNLMIAFTSGVSQIMTSGINIAGTDYEITRNLLPTAVAYSTLTGVREITGINAGSLAIKPRFRCASASAIVVPINTIVSYSVTETL